MPSVWKSEYSGKKFKPSLLPDVDFPIYNLPVAVSGHVSLHFYVAFPFASLRRFKPDVILSTQEPWSLTGLQAVLLSRVLNAPLVFQTNQNIYKRYPPPFSWIEQLSYRTCCKALAYSREAVQVMLQKGLQKPTEVVPYGTDISLFDKARSKSLRIDLGLASSVVLGYMGRFVQEKGLETLIDAVKRVCLHNPDINVKVLMVGSGPDEHRLRQIICEKELNDFFVWTGPVPHIEAGKYMQCMDIFVLPSRTTPRWKEQFGRVIIEALACEVCVVGSDSGQIPILIQETGGGLVFAEGNAADLTEKILMLLQSPDLRRRLARVGAGAVRERYTYESVAQQLHDILAECVQSGNRAHLPA